MFRKKRIKNVAVHVTAMLMVAFMVLVAPGAGMTAFADGITTGTFSSGAKWTFDESNGNLWTSGSGAMDDYDISGHTPWYDYEYSNGDRITEKITQVNLNGGMTTVGDYAFAGVKGIKAVASGSPEDGSQLIRIGDHAFGGCENLVAVKIYGSPSLENIGVEAFWNCRSLSSFDMPKTVKKIGQEAFSACGLTGIAIPVSVTDIDKYAFYNCVKLSNIDFQANVSVLNEGVFRNTNLTQIRLPASVKKIEPYALGTKAEIIDVYLYRGTQIDSKAFENPNINHTAKANLHYYTSISFDGNGASGSMASIVVTDSTYKLPDCKFTPSADKVFEGWEIGNTGTTKKAGENITLTGDVTLKAKWHAHSPKNVHAEKAATCEDDGNISYWECECGKLFNTAGAEVAVSDVVIHKKGHDYGDVTYTFSADGKKCTAARTCKREGCGNKETETVDCISTVKTPAAVGKKGTTTYTAKFKNTAFATQTKNIEDIPALQKAHEHTLVKTEARAATETSEGNKAYWTCSSCGKYFSDAAGKNEVQKGWWIIKKLAHTHKLVKTEAKAATATIAGNKAYWTCSGCGKSFSDAAGTKEIAKNSWVIPAKGSSTKKPAAKGKTISSKSASYVVTSSSKSAPTVKYKATKNSKATTVTIPNTVKINGVTYKITEINAGAFKNKKIKKVTIGKYVTKIGKNAFYGCKYLTTVNGGAAVKIIGANAFYGCIKLTKAPIGAKVTSIGVKAFYNCKAMTTMVIPVNVNKLGTQFAGKTPKLKTLTVKTKKLTKKNIAAKAFTGMGSNKTVTKVPKGKGKTYKNLFQSKGLNKKIKVQQSK